MSSKDENIFFRIAAALLMVTAMAKLYSAGGSARVLQVQDQFIHLGYRPVMIVVALIEIVVATFLLRSRSDLWRSLVLLWLSSNFMGYRLGSYLLGVHLCPCLGHLTDRLPLPPGLADIALTVLVLWWFAGSAGCVWRLWGSERWRDVLARSPGMLGKSAKIRSG